MNRIDRLQAIIIQLQTKKVVKAKEIADRFEISLRTVYRDIKAIEEAGIPIGAEAGVGYFLSENFNLPPIMLTQNEASSIILAGKFLPSIADQQINESFTSAMSKIKAVLNSDQKEELAILESSINVATNFTPPAMPRSIFLQDIQKALIHHQVVQIQYFSNYNKQTSERQVEPVSLLHYASNWHLIAYCRLRNEFRDFRLDRIQQLSLLRECYDREISKDYDRYIQQQNESMALHEIIIKTPLTIQERIKESKYWYGFIKEKVVDNAVQMEFLNPDLATFSKWILTFGKQVEVVSPTSLQTLTQGFVKELCEKYL